MRPEDHQEHVDSINQRFETFLLAHPEAWTEFCKRVNQLRARGIEHYSSDGILHVLRFHTAVDGRDQDVYKINNNFSRCFSRKWQKENPEHADFFATRVIRTA